MRSPAALTLLVLLSACVRAPLPPVTQPGSNPAGEAAGGGVLSGDEASAALTASGASFEVVEASIADIHEAMLAGRLTAAELVDAYIARIDAYDRRGPSLNAIVAVHPGARARAAELDAELVQTGRLTGPLHGIPVIVKDNFDTFDMETTAGSRALGGSVPPDDATMVRRIREAGGIVLAKSNMAEFAFSPLETIGSTLPGYTFNPYALNRVPAGSSGGTAAAVAASFGTVGLGTDTGNSIRGPSAHAALVGIRPTLGLTSRTGIVPLYLERDVGGPMTRTVADGARMLDVVAGVDPEDAATAAAAGRIRGSYTDVLDADALRGARLGVVRRLSNRSGADSAVLAVFDEALAALRAAGATIIDPVELPVMDSVRVTLCSSFRRDLESYIADRRPDVELRTLDAIVESGRFHSSVERRLRGHLDDGDAGSTERCAASADSAERFRAGLRHAMAEHRVDALIYPTWSNAPRLIGDLSTPAGDNSQTPAPPAGFPAITVPMGWVHGTLPAGLQFLGDAWSEPRLIALAYAFEQATLHRRPPASTPPLR